MQYCLNNQIVQNNTSFGNRKVEHKGDFYSTKFKKWKTVE